MSLDEVTQVTAAEGIEVEGGTRRRRSRQFENRIATILRTGVQAAAVMLILSLPWIIAGNGSESDGQTVGDALRRLPDRDPRALAAIGVLIVVATPVVQLLTSVVLFWKKRDRLYVGLTMTVCLIVAAGALFTGGGH